MAEPTNGIKRQIIQQQIAGWEEARYSLQLQHRVQAGIDNKQGLADIEKRLLDCEKAMDMLQKEFEALGT
jgi:hypothetical protein